MKYGESETSYDNINQNLVQKIINPEISPNWNLLKKLKPSKQCIDLLKDLLNKNKYQRMSMSQCMEHQWFKMNLREINEKKLLQDTEQKIGNIS